MREYGETHGHQQPQRHFSPLALSLLWELLVWSVGTVARAMRVLEQSRSEAQATLVPRSRSWFRKLAVIFAEGKTSAK